MDTTCSVCGKADYKRCSCPWSKPFDSWPHALKQRLVAMVAGGPRPAPLVLTT